MIALVSTLSLASVRPFPAASQWVWRGQQCSYVEAGTTGPPILLLHGFAGSAFNAWRSTVPELAKTHRVFALDLLGLGASAQPSDVTYSIDLWREQCSDFVTEKCGDAAPIVIGHSFGSLIALELAAGGDTPVRAVGMMNCAIGMNNKNVAKVRSFDPSVPQLFVAIFSLVLSLIDVLFNQRWLLAWILDKFATAENIKDVLASSVYVTGERVTDDLVQDYLSLAHDKEAAAEVLRQIFTNDGGPLPFDATASLPDDYPILTIWGDTDNLAPATGPVGCHFRARSERFPETSPFVEVAGCGHVPQDDQPQVVNRALTEWLATLQS